jgi:NitT/TauT family transport system substrate-binding protein
LKGKKVSVAVGTPSYTLLVTCLQAAGLSISDITVVKVGSAIESAQFFKSNQVDAAVVWSPDDADCVKNVAGATILTSTKTASYRIADVFVTSSKFLDSHEKELKALVEGWMIGSAEINTNPAAKQAAIKILSSNLNLDDATSELMLNNARLTTYGDNLNFFGLNSSYKGIKGEDLYNTMTEIYKGLGEIPSAPFWRSLISTSIINSLNLTGNGHEAEGQVAFTKATREEAVAPAVSTKKVSINFNTGIFQLSEKHKRIIDIQFSEIAKGFGNARVRIEGNTDNVGSRDFNVSLSGKRAKSVASYLVQEYGYDSNRFIVVGNGPDQPVAENTTDEGRSQNRRTDFELVP